MKVVSVACAFACVMIGCGGSNSPTAPSTPTPTPAARRPERPNIITVLADDLGYGDLSAYRDSIPKEFDHTIETPNLDRLAQEGVRFESFYVPTAICSASRAGFMTGQYPVRAGIPWNPPSGLNGDEIVLAQPLREAGYYSILIGKWHLGYPMPLHWGFDYFYGVQNGTGEWNQGGWYLGNDSTTDWLAPGNMAMGYTERGMQVASEYPSPFWLHIGHRDPHDPMLPNGTTYPQAVLRLDASIGRLREWLETSGLAENTLVFFFSDNGPARHFGSAGQLADGKGSCSEGGVRVPAIAWWPAGIPGGRVIHERVSSLDLFPTFIHLANGTMPNRFYPGQDITPLLTGEADRLPGQGIDGGREILLWWEQGANCGIISGDTKYLRGGSWNVNKTLIDLKRDPGETVNLLTQSPEMEALAARLDARMTELARQ